MNYKVYSDHIEFSEDDGIFWRKVLGLPASISISFEGETVAQLAQDLVVQHSFCNFPNH